MSNEMQERLTSTDKPAQPAHPSALTADKHPGGRPPIEFNLRKVEELARIGCMEEDMAAVLGV